MQYSCAVTHFVSRFFTSGTFHFATSIAYTFEAVSYPKFLLCKNLSKMALLVGNDRPTFNINKCFVCDTSATKTKLQHCGSCKRISYCCKAHQIQDWTNHKKFCGVIKKVEEEIPKENLNEKMAWYYYRLLFHHKCKMGMQRVLKPYEVHMIFFPKRCEICGVINAHIICQTCLCVNYCSEEHRNADSSFHSEKCSDLKLCMNMHYLSEGYGGLDISQR